MAKLIKLINKGISTPYRSFVALRNYLYHTKFLTSHKTAISVISIGNLTFGGTGKTPLVMWLAKKLNELSKHPGILSRGYKSQNGSNDESVMLKELLPNVAYVENPNRVQGCEELRTRHHIDVIILDDGFQHLRLQRDLNILLIDATDAFGGGFCPPAGRLRESLSGISRADVIILTKADLVTDEDKEKIWQTIAQYRPNQSPIELAFVPVGIIDTKTEEKLSLQSFNPKQVTLLSAIGNPKAFRKTVENVGLQVLREYRFRDHHYYKYEELKNIFSTTPGQNILSTYKDWVKIRKFSEFHPLVLLIEPKFLQGQQILEEKLLNVFNQ